MTWIFFAFASAFFDALRNVFVKIGVSDFDEYTLAWLPTFLTALILLPVNIIIGIPKFDSTYVLALIITAVLWAWASILYVKAIKNSDLSVGIPLLSFTPLFLLFFSPLIVHEFPSVLGLIGVLFIVAGSYILNIGEKAKGYLEPFKMLIKETGAKYMLLVAFLWTFTAIFFKIGAVHSSLFFWVMTVNALTSVFIFPFMLKNRGKNNARKSNILNLVFLGLASGIQEIFYVLAVQISLVSYVISIKRTALLLSVGFGYFIFKEKNIKERLLGAALMLAGVVLISLSN